MELTSHGAKAKALKLVTWLLKFTKLDQAPCLVVCVERWVRVKPDIYGKTIIIIDAIKTFGAITRDDCKYKAWKWNTLEVIEEKATNRIFLLDDDELNICIPYYEMTFNSGNEKNLNKIYRGLYLTNI